MILNNFTFRKERPRRNTARAVWMAHRIIKYDGQYGAGMFQITLGKKNIGKKGVKKGLQDEKEARDDRDDYDDRRGLDGRINDTKVKYA